MALFILYPSFLAGALPPAPIEWVPGGLGELVPETSKDFLQIFYMFLTIVLTIPENKRVVLRPQR